MSVLAEAFWCDRSASYSDQYLIGHAAGLHDIRPGTGYMRYNLDGGTTDAARDGRAVLHEGKGDEDKG